MCQTCATAHAKYNHPSNNKKESDTPMIKTTRYARKPFYIDAVQVTAANMDEVAEWCMGDVKNQFKKDSDEEGRPYIKVRVHRPLNERQTMAFVGDWVLYANKGYKVYTASAFERNFEQAETA